MNIGLIIWSVHFVPMSSPLVSTPELLDWATTELTKSASVTATAVLAYILTQVPEL